MTPYCYQVIIVNGVLDMFIICSLNQGELLYYKPFSGLYQSCFSSVNGLVMISFTWVSEVFHKTLFRK